MVKQIIRPIKLRQWFPPNDPLAASVARLCILREDLWLEFRGLSSEVLEELDENSLNWRQLYFLRRSLQTLNEIRGGIQTLCRNPGFKTLISKQRNPGKQEFEELRAKFDEVYELLKGLRNAVGGHILDKKVQETIKGLQPGLEGFIEIGSRVETTHFRFTSELVTEIIDASTRQAQVAGQPSKSVSKLVPVLALIDKIFGWYVKDRGLV